MSNKVFLFLSSALVLLISFSITLTYFQVSAQGEPLYDTLFKKILADGDISIDPATEEPNTDGRGKSVKNINTVNWNTIATSGNGKIISWADIDIEEINCGDNGYIVQIGKQGQTLCKSFIGTYVPVQGQPELPPACPAGSVLSIDSVTGERRCLRLQEKIVCAPGEKAQRIAEEQGEMGSLHCLSGREEIVCHKDAYDSYAQIGEKNGYCVWENLPQYPKCSHDNTKNCVNKMCSIYSNENGILAYKTVFRLKNRETEEEPPYSFVCAKNITKTCPEGYRLDPASTPETEPASLTCNLL